jgi:GNAT superfamily N-acetyltransferase
MIELAAGRLFAEIGLQQIADDPPDDLDTLRCHWRDGTIWVAEVGGAVVGYALASVVDGEGHLDQVSVLPEHGRRGIGAALIAEVEAWARRRGDQALTLTTFRDVEWNGPYYARLGFEPIPDEQLGPELRAIRDRERADGLDVLPRQAMRLRIV